MNKELITKIEKFAKEKLKHADPGHDFLHVERVRNNAKLLHKSEKGDWFIIEAAVLLHDVGDRKILKIEEDDYSISRNFLKKLKLDTSTVDKVMYIIENVSFHKHSAPDMNNKEFCIVQDADMLDGIGAIGIARTFSYGGSLNRPIHNTSKGVDKHNPSTYDHFEEKLFLLKNLMNTKTAKQIAKERHIFMEEYIKQLNMELQGKK